MRYQEILLWLFILRNNFCYSEQAYFFIYFILHKKKEFGMGLCGHSESDAVVPNDTEGRQGSQIMETNQTAMNITTQGLFLNCNDYQS